MLRYYLILTVVLVIGILIGYGLLSGRGPEQATVINSHPLPPPVTSFTPLQPDVPEALATLQQQMQQAHQAREQLAMHLAALQQRLEELELERDTAEVVTQEAASRESAPKPATSVLTSVQSLIDAGINPEQAVWIQEQLDEIDLQQLYLQDRATREGWLNKPRYYKERREHLNAVTKLRTDVGDYAYDRMLYALGRVNRVVIRDTMKHSQATQYGLQAGDLIIEYDGQRIFTSNELNTLALQGSVGVMTLMRVQRDGNIQDIYLPHGPLGVRMATARVSP